MKDTHNHCSLSSLFRYLREVGFPDSVLEARLSRIAAYKSLYAQNHTTATEDSSRIESPKVTVSREGERGGGEGEREKRECGRGGI